jgi:hypothetical protein
MAMMDECVCVVQRLMFSFAEEKEWIALAVAHSPRCVAIVKKPGASIVGRELASNSVWPVVPNTVRHPRLFEVRRRGYHPP